MTHLSICHLNSNPPKKDSSNCCLNSIPSNRFIQFQFESQNIFIQLYRLFDFESKRPIWPPARARPCSSRRRWCRRRGPGRGRGAPATAAARVRAGAARRGVRYTVTLQQNRMSFVLWEIKRTIRSPIIKNLLQNLSKTMYVAAFEAYLQGC